MASCGFNQSNSDSEVKDAHASDGVMQVNPKAFNAFNIWRDGQGSEILDYPQDYYGDGHQTSDGVFYVEATAWWKDGKFIGVPTEGAEVVNDVLEYPVKNGRELKLKFTYVPADRWRIWSVTQPDAIEYCKSKDLRLPTLRELFDYCAAGVTEPNYGPNYVSGRYPTNARCGENQPWSSSLVTKDGGVLGAWIFADGDHDGFVWGSYVSNPGFGLACVGGVTPTPTPTPEGRVNPNAFNAFNIWRDGQGSEILDYPQGYDVESGSIPPDGVFYVQESEYSTGRSFIGVPTEGAKVVNDVLEYPIKNNKWLKLKFTDISEEKMQHRDAVSYCKHQGLRLPTVREIFDFCAAEVTEPSYGSGFKWARYPNTARCAWSAPWSASVLSDEKDGNSYAWLFSAGNGTAANVSRSPYGNPHDVRCVGPAE
jgi:hypothetical protein